MQPIIRNMLPMVRVDLEALEQLGKERRPDGDGVGLEGRAAKAQPPTEVERDREEDDESETAGPAEGAERADEHLMGVLREDVGETLRAEAERTYSSLIVRFGHATRTASGKRVSPHGTRARLQNDHETNIAITTVFPLPSPSCSHSVGAAESPVRLVCPRATDKQSDSAEVMKPVGRSPLRSAWKS